MLKRLGVLVITLGLLLCLGTGSALARTTTIAATDHGHWLQFRTQGVSLDAVQGADVRIGHRRFSLDPRRLRAIGRARAVVITGVVAATATGAVLDLTTTAHHAAPTSSAPTGSLPRSSQAPVLRVSPLLRANSPSAIVGNPGLVVGINVGSAIQWELQFAHTLGAQNVRMDIPLGTPLSQIDPIVAAYAQAGIRPELLATFDGTIPDAAQDAELAAWAARYGPGGTFWSTGVYNPTLAVTRIEFGNESSFQYQYPKIADNPQWYATPYYTQIAEQYAQSYVQAVKDVSAANSAVKVLAVADSPGDVPQWLAGMFKGAPDLADVVQGWILHPYGNEWRTDVDKTLAQAGSLGAPSSVPVYVTEVGVATSGGQCLQNNYGFNPCMSFAQAAETLTGQVGGIESLLGSRLAELDLYSARDLAPDGSSSDPEDFFGALQSGGQPKGAFTTAVESILATTAG